MILKLRETGMHKFLPPFWILPFIFFLAGYYALSRLVVLDEVPVPALVGLSLSDGLKSLSAVGLQGSIIAEHDDADLPAGTVIEQRPRAGTVARRARPIYLTITRLPEPLRAPSCVGKTKEVIEGLIEKPVRVKYHELEAITPRGICLAQCPAAGEPLDERVVHVYLSAGLTSIRMFPDVRGLAVADVVPFLKSHGMTVQLYHKEIIADGHECTACTIHEQKPLAGTIVDLSKPMVVQLQVRA